MKKILVIVSLALVCFYACDSETLEIDIPFDIQYSNYSVSTEADGYLMYQNYGGPRIDLVVDSAYMKDLDSASVYVLKYWFANVDNVISDSLEVYIQTFTSDQNYHSDADSSQNCILGAIFNVDTLLLDASALQVAPVDSNQTLYTVLNLQTSDEKGDFNGTVDCIPLVKDSIAGE
jgi:hypothetical protein